MQRQSLGGSPSSKLQLPGDNEDKKKTAEEDGNVSLEDKEAEKQQQQHRVEKSIHLIPILIIFCLLILYLYSYDPPQKKLAHITGFSTIPYAKDWCCSFRGVLSFFTTKMTVTVQGIIDAVIISLLVSLAAAGGFLGWIGFFWAMWMASKKGMPCQTLDWHDRVSALMLILLHSGLAIVNLIEIWTEQ